MPPPAKGTKAYDEWRRKLSEAKKGKKVSDELKESWKVECKCSRCDSVFMARINTRLYCKECLVQVKKENQKKYRLAHKQEIAERKRKFRQENPEKHRKWLADWSAKNREHVAKKAREWRKANSETYRQQARESYWRNWEKKAEQRQQNAEQRHEWGKRWRRANLEKDAAKSRRRHAKKRGATGSHTLAEFIAVCESWEWKCAYCGTQLDRKTITEDHYIPVSKGGTDNIDNIIPACRSCNSRKCDLLPEEFFNRYNITIPDKGGVAL